MENHHLTDKQIYGLGFKIIEVLDGIPISQARHVLLETETLLLDCHMTDTKNARFKEKLSELKVSVVSREGSTEPHH